MNTSHEDIRHRRCARALVFMGLVLLSGCSREPVYLMPTPEIMRDERFDVFSNNPYLESVDEITTYFATTRKPKKPGDPKVFSINHGGSLTLGTVTLQIGEEGDAWRSIYSKSVMPDEDDRVALKLTNTRIDASLDLVEVDEVLRLDEPSDALALSESPAPLGPGAEKFFAALNGDLDKSPTQVLTVFVHGANNSFEESIARGAQIQYFTGNADVALTYAWPSAGSIWRYGHDVRNANRSAADFAEFLKLLSLYSTAKHINIIGYSAGGRIVGGALTLLADELPESFIDSLPKSPRTINQIYLAASDEKLSKFGDNYPSYSHLVNTITVTVNPDDHVLGMAGIVGGGVRLGGAGGGKYLEKLPEDQQQRLVDLINGGNLDIVDMQINDIAGFEYSHEAWYANPWLSSDVLITLYLGLDPESRGLRTYQTADDLGVWYFPENYLSTLKDTLLEYFD
ncbi:MAG: alpha/beta hydrolase [Gammaproteobacteria bacterium]|nr:alpha/beta hydrolase [Gammaproteobacteria bacterium]